MKTSIVLTACERRVARECRDQRGRRIWPSLLARHRVTTPMEGGSQDETHMDSSVESVAACRADVGHRGGHCWGGDGQTLRDSDYDRHVGCRRARLDLGSWSPYVSRRIGI